MKKMNRYLLGIVVILVLTSALFIFGDRGSSAQPSTYNTKGRGMAAFSELLEQSGYNVVIDRSPRPQLLPNDLVIYGVNERQLEATDKELDLQMQIALEAHWRKGGHSMELFFTMHESPQLSPSPETFRVPGSEKSFAVRLDDGKFDEIHMDDISVVTGSYPLVSLTQWEQKGAILVVNRGVIARNRFIGQDQNAELLLFLTDTMLKPGGRVVFAEGTFGAPEQRNALDELGGWATTAWWQIMLIGVVVVYSMGRRFGVPTREMSSQRGARELMGAVGDILRRARRHNYALMIIRNDAIHRLRNAYRMPAHTVEGDVLMRAPDELRHVLEQIRRVQYSGITPKSAIETAQRVEYLVSTIENEQKAERSLSP